MTDTKIKDKLNIAMGELKEQNPMASWQNLFLGVAIVMMVITSSLIYFNRLAANAIVEDKTKQIEVPQTKDSTDKETTDKEQETKATTAFVSVQEGEGLWNVAERVCGNGEKYVFLAQANGLSLESEVNPGQKLLVKCD